MVDFRILFRFHGETQVLIPGFIRAEYFLQGRSGFLSDPSSTFNDVIVTHRAALLAFRDELIFSLHTCNNSWNVFIGLNTHFHITGTKGNGAADSQSLVTLGNRSLALSTERRNSTTCLERSGREFRRVFRPGRVISGELLRILRKVKARTFRDLRFFLGVSLDTSGPKWGNVAENRRLNRRTAPKHRTHHKFDDWSKPHEEMFVKYRVSQTYCETFWVKLDRK